MWLGGKYYSILPMSDTDRVTAIWYMVYMKNVEIGSISMLIGPGKYWQFASIFFSFSASENVL